MFCDCTSFRDCPYVVFSWYLSIYVSVYWRNDDGDNTFTVSAHRSNTNNTHLLLSDTVLKNVWKQNLLLLAAFTETLLTLQLCLSFAALCVFMWFYTGEIIHACVHVSASVRLPGVCRCCIMVGSISESARVTQQITAAWSQPRKRLWEDSREMAALLRCSKSSWQKCCRRNFLHLPWSSVFIIDDCPLSGYFVLWLEIVCSFRLNAAFKPWREQKTRVPVLAETKIKV